MTHGACLLFATVFLVQSSFGAQAEPEVARRGQLRGNRTAAVTDSFPQASEEGCEEAVAQVREEFEFQIQCTPRNFTLLSCSWHVNAGISYSAKVDAEPCGPHGFTHLRIHRGVEANAPVQRATLEKAALDVERHTSLENFSSEISGATLGGRCFKKGSLCPWTESWCCSGHCVSTWSVVMPVPVPTVGWVCA
jgi:hypothetical protein